MRRWLLAPVIAMVVVGVAAGCAQGRSPSAASKTQASKYTPKTRSINMFAVPAFIGEDAGIPALKDFAAKDFKKGGLNDGNEVFRWDPQTIAVCKGDTLKLSIGNPGPDAHTFTLPSFSVNKPIPVGKETPVSFKASKVGFFDFYCTVAEHTKYMHGTLLVFPDTSSMCNSGSSTIS